MPPYCKTKESEGAATVRPDCVRPSPRPQIAPCLEPPLVSQLSAPRVWGRRRDAAGSTAASCRATTSARRGAGLQEGRGHDLHACWQLACDCLLQFANLRASTNPRSHGPQRQGN
jgi:hypothetical protein